MLSLIDQSLQYIHVLVFGCIWYATKDEVNWRMPAKILVASGIGYIFLAEKVWPAWDYTLPLGVFFSKIVIDIFASVVLLQFPSKFAKSQSFLIWCSVILNSLVMAEWPFRNINIIYNSYEYLGIAINMLQLFAVSRLGSELVYDYARRLPPINYLSRVLCFHLVDDFVVGNDRRAIK